MASGEEPGENKRMKYDYLEQMRRHWIGQVRPIYDIREHKCEILWRLEKSEMESDDDVREIESWKYLIETECYMTSLPSTIGRCRNLVTVDVSKNQLTSLPSSFSQLSQLKELDISQNAFTELPAVVYSLSQLEKLNVDNNKLSMLHSDISHLTSFKHLDLSHNAFKELPTGVYSLSQLEKLDIGYNKLSKIHPDISHLTSLKDLHLGDNEFKEFPTNVCSLSNLDKLELCFNKLTSVPSDISKMQRLASLNLGGNTLTEFPVHVCSLSKLETLYLFRNQINTIPQNIIAMTSIEHLQLSENKFIEFPVHICQLPNLQLLYVNYNPLTSLPPEIANLRKLSILDISYTNITHFPLEIEHLEQLRSLNVSDNPYLIQPPESVCKRGKDAIFRYLRELRETKAVKTNRLQLNLLGETESGKSSLSQSLKRGEPTLTHEADRTHVIEQIKWEPAGKDSILNINDFGGHEVYKVGHPLFINKRGSALITFDMSKYEKNAEHYRLHIGDWIRTIHCHAPDVKVAICGTHQDKVDDAMTDEICKDVEERLREDIKEEENWLALQIERISEAINRSSEGDDFKEGYQKKQSHLQEQAKSAYNIHEEIFRISSNDRKGYDALEKYLITVAKDRGVVLPETWVDVMHEIERKKYEPDCSSLSLEDLKTLVQNTAAKKSNTSTEMSPEDIDNAVHDVLDYMSSSGEVVWFERRPGCDTRTDLENIIFHKQEVLANLLKAVLHHDMDMHCRKLLCAAGFTKKKVEDTERDFVERGTLSREAMVAMWKPFCLTSEEKDAMVELMQTLELCYTVTQGEDATGVTGTTDTFHFPCLLNESRPESITERWPDEVPSEFFQLTLQCETQHRYPHGLFERLSVRLHQYLGIYSRKRVDWKDGVYAEKGSCQLLLTQQQMPHDMGQDWVITAAIRSKPDPNLEYWDFLFQVHNDLMDILRQNWPGLTFFRYLLCPHCVQAGIREPTKFPGEILNKPFETPRHQALPCEHAPDRRVPARLVYPAAAGYTRERVIRRNRVTLVRNLTEPGIKDMLNRLQAESIFTSGDAETVKSKETRYGMAEEFLDLLVKKEDRGFDVLYNYLMESGQKHIAQLIRIG